MYYPDYDCNKTPICAVTTWQSLTRCKEVSYKMEH